MIQQGAVQSAVPPLDEELQVVNGSEEWGLWSVSDPVVVRFGHMYMQANRFSWLYIQICIYIPIHTYYTHVTIIKEEITNVGGGHGKSPGEDGADVVLYEVQNNFFEYLSTMPKTRNISDTAMCASWEVRPEHIPELTYVSHVPHTYSQKVILPRSILVHWHFPCVPVTQTVCRLSTCTIMLVPITFQTLEHFRFVIF